MLPATVIEPISECFVASLIIGWAAHHVFRWDIMVFFLCHCLAWFVSDYIQLRGVQVRLGFAKKTMHNKSTFQLWLLFLNPITKLIPLRNVTLIVCFFVGFFLVFQGKSINRHCYNFSFCHFIFNCCILLYVIVFFSFFQRAALHPSLSWTMRWPGSSGSP